MVKLNNLSAISAAVLLSVSIGTRAAPIMANNSDVIVNAKDVIERIFASGHEAKITGASIKVYDDEAYTMAVGATNAGIIVIGDENTEQVSIEDPLDETAVVSSQSESQISINAANIIVKGNAGSQGVKVETSGGITIGSAMTDSVDISSGASAVYGKSGNVSIFGKKIKLSSSSSDAVSFYTAGAVTIGDKNTDSINLKSSADGCAAVFLKRVSTDPGDAGLNATITGNNVTIASDAKNGVGIWLQNGTEGAGADRPAVTTSLTVNANNLEINASQGILAYSNSSLDIEGDVEINSEVAIVARGNSTVNINETCSTCKTVINGDVVFMTTNTSTDSDDSGRIINADVNLNLSGADSQWNGRAYQTYKDESGEMIEVVDIYNGNEYHGNVKDFTVGLKSGAKWNVTGDSFINAVSVSDGATIVVSENAKVLNSDKIDLNGGVLTMEGDATQQVSVNTLSGTGGTINVATKHSEEGGFTTANLKIANVVTAETAPALAVKYTGITSDALTAENTKDLKALDIDSGTASVSEYVEEGNIKGAWTRTTTADGKTTEGYSENTKLSSYSSITAMSLVQWRNEINHLTKRLGDIRASESTIGAWARVYGGASEWGSNPEVDMDHTTIQVGGDYRVSPNWIVGGAFSYTDSDAESSNGFADGKSYSLAAYATYLADNGSFLDMIARYGYLKNDITAGNMALETKNNAFSLSVEGGHQFRFIEDRAYIEPQIELTYGFVSGDDADASNSVRIEQDDYQNLITRVGVRTGFDFPEKAGTIYATLSYSYDFLGDVDGTASGQTEAGYESVALTEDLGGGWVTYGIGAQFRLGDNAFAYGELERTSGGDIDNPYLFNVGFRYNF